MGFFTNYVLNLPTVMLGREPLHPLIFSYYVTHRCDLNCTYCSDGDGKRFTEDPIAELSAAEAGRLLAILRRASDTLDITGGEPLVRDDLEEILAKAHALGFRTVLNTKGRGIEQRAKLLSYVDTLVISLDTLEPEQLSRIIGRPQAYAAEILAALHFLVQQRRALGIKLVLSAVATPENLEGVSAVLSFARAHGLGFHVSPEILGTQANPQLLGDSRYTALIEAARQAKRQAVGVLGIDAYLEGIQNFRRFRCNPLLMPVIRPDGRMYYPCLESKQAQISVLEAGDYGVALRQARARYGEVPACGQCCHIFCHMALSLLQQHPLDAWSEMRHWSRI